MSELNIGLALFLLIAIVVPPQKYMGAKGFMSDWDSLIEKPNKRLSPPRLIQIRYGIGKSPINIVTYLTFLSDFANWILCIVALPCVLLFQNDSLDVVMAVYVIVFLTIDLPIGIARTICTIKTSKRLKIKTNTEVYVVARLLFETFADKSNKEALRKHKEYVEIIEPFLKEYEKCLVKIRGIDYISNDNLQWMINKIIPKYEKHLSYNVLNETSKKRFVSIYLLRDNTVIKQTPIKK